MLVSNVMIVIEGKIFLLLVRDVRVECYTAVNKFVLTTLVTLESLPSNLFLTIDKAIFVSMMVEVDLADTSINLNNFLPVVRRSSTVVMLYQFELIGESSSEDKIVFAILIVAANLIYNQSLKVLVNDNTANKSINLRTFREEVNLALFVENGLFSIGT